MHFLKNLGLFALFAVAASASDGFARTCENIETFGSMLRADCREYHTGRIQPTVMNLNHCLKNDQGRLKCGRNGNYQASCINCSLRGHSEFECQCRDTREGHRFVPAHIDLSRCIGNDHGELRC